MGGVAEVPFFPSLFSGPCHSLGFRGSTGRLPKLFGALGAKTRCLQMSMLFNLLFEREMYCNCTALWKAGEARHNGRTFPRQWLSAQPGGIGYEGTLGKMRLEFLQRAALHCISSYIILGGIWVAKYNVERSFYAVGLKRILFLIQYLQYDVSS